MLLYMVFSTSVVAVVLRSRCVVLCTVCKFVSNVVLATIHHILVHAWKYYMLRVQK